VSGASLAGRRALVTGAARRTGKALALALAAEGADVAVHYRHSAEEAEATAEAVRALGQDAVAVQADLASGEEAQRAVDEVVRALGGLEILVNNVGAIIWKDLPDTSPEEWHQGLDGTLNATYHMCHAALPKMRGQQYGRVINVLDATADDLGPAVHATAYKIGKTGSLILTRTLAVTEAEHGITVNALSPGTLEDSERKPPLETIPAGRYGRYEDLISTLVFLCSEEANYVTGNHWKVSGGYRI
jgi:3-oxoacyl-[acyl-carrier protein] reductase